MKRTIFMIACLALNALACLGTASLDGGAVVVDSTAAATMTQIPRVVVPTVGATSTPAPAGERCAVVVAESSLHLRGEPSADGLILTWLDHGEIVTVIDQSDSDWWRVRIDGAAGFARSLYLRDSECSK